MRGGLRSAEEPAAGGKSARDSGDRRLPAQQIIRQRWSAVAMTSPTRLPRHAFYDLLRRLTPRGRVPFGVLPWPTFFDDALHQVLGIEGRAWQSLYHFAVGGPLEDLRLQTLPPYAHLQAP